VRRYLLDTGPAQSYVFRRGNIYQVAGERSRAGARVGICLPVLGELFGGMELSDTKERNLRRLLHEIEDLVMWPFDVPAAKKFGEPYAYLMRNGRPMPQIDIQIAAIALTLANCTLVTADSDFHAIPGLTIENWS